MEMPVATSLKVKQVCAPDTSDIDTFGKSDKFDSSPYFSDFDTPLLINSTQDFSLCEPIDDANLSLCSQQYQNLSSKKIEVLANVNRKYIR